MPSIHSKLPQTGTSIFSVMSALAAEHNAINLGQGFPDFSMDEELAVLTTKAILDGQNQYVPMAGYLPLREAIAQKNSTALQHNRLTIQQHHHHPRRYLCYLYGIHHHLKPG